MTPAPRGRSSHGLLRVMKPRLPNTSALVPRLRAIESAQIYSNYGPQVTELEQRLASRLEVSVDQVVVLANATLGLQGAVSVLGAPGWVAPAWTFTATGLAILAAGKNLQFIDVDDASHLAVEQIARHEPAVVTLPFGVGLPPQMKSGWSAPLVIDAAASLGNVDSLRGALGPQAVVVFSLHATKYLGAGEGAVVVCGSPSVAQLIRTWSNFGFNDERVSQVPGTNGKMSEFQAVVAHAALDQEPDERAAWKRARALAAQVEQAHGIGIPQISTDNVGPYWIVRFSSEEVRDQAVSVFASHRIETRKWWSDGCHVMPAFSRVQTRGQLKVTNELAGSTLGLPFFRGMTSQDFDRVEAALSELIP